MADISQYSIVTYERKPGHWRAAFVRKALTESAVRGDTVHCSVTPDNYASESEAKFAAEKIIRRLLIRRCPPISMPSPRAARCTRLRRDITLFGEPRLPKYQKPIRPAPHCP
jgi:hypothetical protein